MNTKIVGKSAVKIAEMAGFKVPPGLAPLWPTPTASARSSRSRWRSFLRLLGFYVVKDWQEGCAKCIEILSFGGLGHTLSLHTREDRIVREFGLKKPAFRICVNTPAALGAVGYTTNLFPSMTLGCGAQGNNITSDNISPLHLINLKRVAYGVRDVAAPPPKVASVASATAGTSRATIEQVVDQWLGRGNAASPPSPSGRGTSREARQGEGQPATISAPVAPPLSSYKELEPPKTESRKKGPQTRGLRL